jgi:hypothetical protein
VASGTLSPHTVAVPAGYNVQVTFLNHGGSTESVIIHTKPPVTLLIPAHGHSSAIEKHLPKGTYPISINGRDDAGSLVIGAAPGP